MGNKKSKKTADGKAAGVPTVDNVPFAVLLERRMMEKLGMAPPMLEAAELLDHAAKNGIGPDEVVRLAADSVGVPMDEVEADDDVTSLDLAVFYRQMGLTSSGTDNDPIDAKVSALRAKLAFLLSRAGDAPEEDTECSE